MGMENTIEKRKSAKEGGLEEGIKKMRDQVSSLTSMIDQIELLQKVPAQYKNLAGEGKVDSRELPALDQWETKRTEYDARIKKVHEALQNAYMAVMEPLDLLRGTTGISSRDEAMKFDKNTGRQEKDR